MGRGLDKSISKSAFDERTPVDLGTLEPTEAEQQQRRAERGNFVTDAELPSNLPRSSRVASLSQYATNKRMSWIVLTSSLPKLRLSTLSETDIYIVEHGEHNIPIVVKPYRTVVTAFFLNPQLIGL